MDQFLVNVIYPLIVAFVVAIFSLIYGLFKSMLTKMNHLQTTVFAHHVRIVDIERRCNPNAAAARRDTDEMPYQPP
jgi:hypothetical protein